jgi:hypothetical protein
MARGTPASQGRAARSEFEPAKQFIEKAATLDDTSVGKRFLEDYRVKGSTNLTVDGVKQANLDKIVAPLNEIKQKLIPTPKVDLADRPTRESDRYISVFTDKSIGFTALRKSDEYEKLRNSLPGERGLADKIVVEYANTFLKNAYNDGIRDFSVGAGFAFNRLRAMFPEDKAAQLVQFALREGFDRMQRAGMTYQEKDPRFPRQK